MQKNSGASNGSSAVNRRIANQRMVLRRVALTAILIVTCVFLPVADSATAKKKGKFKLEMRDDSKDETQDQWKAPSAKPSLVFNVSGETLGIVLELELLELAKTRAPKKAKVERHRVLTLFQLWSDWLDDADFQGGPEDRFAAYWFPSRTPDGDILPHWSYLLIDVTNPEAPSPIIRVVNSRRSKWIYEPWASMNELDVVISFNHREYEGILWTATDYK